MNLSTIKNLLSELALVAMLSGCVIGNGTICGPQTPLAYCDREAYQKLLYPTPISDLWEKATSNAGDRRQDWMDCGGDADGGYSTSQTELNGRTAREAANIKYDQIQYCMLNKGYRYTGICQGDAANQHIGCSTGTQ